MEILITLAILIFSAILHEVAHGFVADRLGDPTARLSGRLTLNPKSHIDPVMSVLLPLALLLSGSPVIFGAAKPVPVDEFNLREGRKDIALVALAGPLTNILLAVFSALLFRIFFSAFAFEASTAVFSLISVFLYKTMQINLLLAIFNLLPIPPLDGSKVFSLLLPEQEARTYMGFGMVGMFILFFLLAFPIGGFSLGAFVFNLLTFAQSLLLP